MSKYSKKAEERRKKGHVCIRFTPEIAEEVRREGASYPGGIVGLFTDMFQKYLVEKEYGDDKEEIK